MLARCRFVSVTLALATTAAADFAGLKKEEPGLDTRLNSPLRGIVLVSEDNAESL